MARFQYGGQALIEGVLMRGRHALAVALRHPDGSIVWATERLDLGLRARRAMRLPFLRGLVVLYDTLVTWTRWLVRSATLQALAEEAAAGDGKGKGSGKGSGVGSGVAGAILHSIVRPRPPRPEPAPSTPTPTPPRRRSLRRRKAWARATPWPSAACCS